MVILGLTGSIGMGKTTAAKTFRRLGVPVYDADQAVHDLMAPGGAAVEQVADLFPGAKTDAGGIDRIALGSRVFGDDTALRKLESILHPLVRGGENVFLRACARRGARMVVLDIPLLYETGGEDRCDAVVVVSAPAHVQRRRVLKRPGMTPAKLNAILARQVPDDVKRFLADFVVPTGLSRNLSLRTIAGIVKTVSTWRGRNWPPRPYLRSRHA